MNKYLGFYELKRLGIPTVPWQMFTNDTILDNSNLWTLRVATEGGDDLNLPRYVGVTGEESLIYGKQLLSKYKDVGIVIFYPYFIAEKSGVMDINQSRIVIEAVSEDLWNLVTHGNREVTLEICDDSKKAIGNEMFLTENEIDELQKYANIIKSKFRNDMAEGKSLIAEWSYAYKSDINKSSVGERYLVFYEIRSI